MADDTAMVDASDAGEERGTYQFAYGPNTPYAHAVGLVERHRAAAGEVVVDLGCGYGAIAEPVRDLGLSYLGVDLDPGGLKSLVERGMEAVTGDLTRPDALVAEIRQALGDRPVAALCALDAVEHVANADELLAALSRFALELGGVPLVVSIPNVSHFDLAAKLLLGRWDVTPTGLLDATHVRFFSPSGLERAMAHAGWGEVDADDLELGTSDQHFPADAVVLERESALGALLARVRREAAPGWITNQFVRAYLPRRPTSVTELPPAPDPAQPFLTVLVRTRGTRMTTLVETLLSLAAQTCDDFEVLVLCHDVAEERTAVIRDMVAEFHPSFSGRVRVVPVTGGGRSRPLNVGAVEARGHYLAALDDDDLAFAHWVEALRDAWQAAPGHMLHIGVARQNVVHTPEAWGPEGGYDVVSKPRAEYPLTFDLLSHLWDNWTPNNGYAVPRSFVNDLGQRYDESLPVLEDWDFLLRAASFCGTWSAGVIGGLVRVWVEGENSMTAHDEEVWEQARRTVRAKFDGAPLLMGKGTMSRAFEVLGRLADAEHQVRVLHAERDVLNHHLHNAGLALAGARAELDQVRRSTSWRLTAPVRAVTGLVRRGRRRATADREEHDDG